MKIRLVLLVTALLAGVALAPAGARQAPRTASAGETEAERIARETQQAARASERSALKTSLAPLTRAQRQQLQIAVTSTLPGRWTSCQLPTGFNPVHASVLPDGSVLLMAGSGNDPAQLAAGQFQSYIFYPDTCGTYALPTPGDMFCSGHTMLPGGNILVAGGTQRYDPFYRLRTSYEYNWVSKQFVKVASMAAGRWYPGATELGSGDAFVLSGLNGVGALNTRPEVYHYRTRTWSSMPYTRSVPTYAQMLPTAGGRLFFTGVGFGGSAVQVGFLVPLTGGFQAVSGLDTNRRDQGASFFVPFTAGRKVMVAGGGVASTALIDLYSSANPVYKAGPSLATATKYLSHATLFDGQVLLAGGQDPLGNPVYTAQVYRPTVNRIETVTPTSAAATFAHKQAFTAKVALAAGTTLKSLRVFRLASTTHQFGAAEGDFTLTATSTSTGPGWSLTASASLTPPGYYYLVAVDSRGVPSVAKIVKVT